MLQLFFFYFTFAPAKEPKDLNLIIDIGNTKAKIAFFDGGEIVDIVAESNQSLGCLKAFCSKYPVEQGIVATVIDLSEKVLADLAALPFPLLWLNHQTPLPVVNLYETPETLGLTLYSTTDCSVSTLPTSSSASRSEKQTTNWEQRIMNVLQLNTHFSDAAYGSKR